jgi:hypothetical protein
MRIRLKTSGTTLGSKGEVVSVGDRLALGLIRRNQAEEADDLDSMTVAELQEVAKEKGVSYSGLKKAQLLKELKETIYTKEDKTNYQTK